MRYSLAAISMTLALLAAHPAVAGKYVYLHSEGEYSVELPDAPVATTIWGDDANIPYLDNPAKFGPIGERVSVRQVDPKTGDMFSVEIVFLKASRDYLLSLTAEKIMDMIHADYKGVQLEDMKPGYAPGSDTLKWATLSGYSTDKNNKPLFNMTHFLAGSQTVMVVRIQYHVQNKAYNDLYKSLSASIKYNLP